MSNINQHQDLAIGGKGKARGRKDSTGQEAVIQIDPIRDSITNLGNLYDAYVDARGALNDAVKAVAEKSGLQSSVVRKLVNARGNDKFEQENVKVQQAALLFDEMGGGSLRDMDVGNGKPKRKKLTAADSSKNGPGDDDDDDGDPDPLAGSDLARKPPEGISASTLKQLDDASADAKASAEKKAERIAAAAVSKAKH